MSADSPQMLEALNHTLRRHILRAFQGQTEEVDPVWLARSLDSAISETAYHLGFLVKTGALKRGDPEPEERAGGRLYTLTRESRAEWVRGALEALRESDDGSRA